MTSKLLKKLPLIAIIFLLTCFFTHNAIAESFTGYLNKEERNCRNIEKLQKEIETYKNTPISELPNKSEIEQKRENFIAQLQGIVDVCLAAEKYFPNSMGNLKKNDEKMDGFLGIGAESESDRNAAYNKGFSETLSQLSENATAESNKSTAANLLNNYYTYNYNVDVARDALDTAFEAGGGKSCGPKFPYGCPAGQKCIHQSADMSRNVGTSTSTYHYQIENIDTYKCMDEAPEDIKIPTIGNITHSEAKEGEGEGETNKHYMTVMGRVVDTEFNADGSYSIKTNIFGYQKRETVVDKYGNKVDTSDSSRSYYGDNSACDIAGMQNKYQSRCYSCKIILTLITTFMNACGRVYDLTREAGGKVLVIGSLIWFAAFSLKLVSSFTNQEPMSILNDFFIFMFKAASAYIFLNAGIGIIINLLVNPLLIAGADYGIGLMKAANEGIVNIATTTNYAYSGTEIISAKVINKLMALTQGIDKTVANNLVIGHALTCHSFNAGMITHVLDLKLITVTLRIPDIWIWLCGAAIWFCGFMLTLGVGYYLLDVCFKIGFCIIALPIVIGLWPFKMTEDKFKSCMSIIIRSAALFAFLALTVSYALSLISVSLGDLTVFFEKIKAGDHEWISDTFSISGSKFIIIMFAYVYSIKMVGATVTGYLDRFFSDSVFGGASPMHNKATQITDFAKQKVTQAAGFAGGVVTHQASRATAAVLGGTVNMVKRAVRGKKSGGGASSGMRAAGQGMKTAGKGAEAAGKGVEAAGKGISAAGKGISGAAQAANVIPVAGQVVAAAGAAAGTAVSAAGAATQAAGKATQAAGKAAQVAGKATQAAAKGAEKVENAAGAANNAINGEDNKES